MAVAVGSDIVIRQMACLCRVLDGGIMQDEEYICLDFVNSGLSLALICINISKI